jgi:hypothetical protein
MIIISGVYGRLWKEKVMLVSKYYSETRLKTLEIA